jgi:hypothetical protein
MATINTEKQRLQDAHMQKIPWKKWGPYLSDRQWGTVREDYSPYGSAWDFFPHDHARSRAYRWGEDGIAGISDDRQLLCFAIALWNGEDPILKERLFGLTGNEGNHGEDVKEYYFYLGLDNIGVFDRSAPLPTGGHLEQSDGTSWMAMYALNMLTIALELSLENPVYEDIATKFFEHFIYISAAMSRIGMDRDELWDEADGFFYDVLELPNGQSQRLKVRSMVGLIPLFAVTSIEPELLNRLPAFKERLEWFIQNRPNLVHGIACMETPGMGARRLLAIASQSKLPRILSKMLDETEFLSPYGIRALSKLHDEHPYIFDVNGTQFRVNYEPAESSSGLFGGNSNWRGPVWFPVNFLLIESLQQFHHYLGDAFKVECPTGSGQMMTLWEVASELSQRLIQIFTKDSMGQRPLYGGTHLFQHNPHWQNLILFYEYFHGDNGAGIGASHQTGWTGLVAKLIQQFGEYEEQQKARD